MSWIKLHKRAIELALERGEIDYVNFAQIAGIHPSYASQVLAEAARIDDRVVYYRGVLHSMKAYRERRLAELKAKYGVDQNEG